jgi:hypothetical protein
MKNSEDLLIDLARLHRNRAEELVLAAFRIWLQREVQPQLKKISDIASARMHAGKLTTRDEILDALDSMPFDGPGLVDAAQESARRI